MGRGRVGLLFWFYRDLPVCQNRLDLLRRHNPDLPIYGVYGGDPSHAARFRAGLRDRLDDFWAFERPVPARWKWRHGDLLLADWYAQRGHELEWDHVFVVQWDMLVLEPVAAHLPELGPRDVLLSGVRPVSALGGNWVWSRGGHAATYQEFVASLDARFGPIEPLSCLFVVACLPRALLAAYGELANPEVGYVEYRLPTLASAVGLRFVDDGPFAAWRPADAAAGPPTRRQQFLNGSRRAVRLPTVLAELARRDGARLFHPYHGLFPVTWRWAATAPAWAAYTTARSARDAVVARSKRP